MLKCGLKTLVYQNRALFLFEHKQQCLKADLVPAFYWRREERIFAAEKFKESTFLQGGALALHGLNLVS